MSHHPPHLRVVAVARDRLCTFEFGCVYEIFGLPRPEPARPWYRFDRVATRWIEGPAAKRAMCPRG